MIASLCRLACCVLFLTLTSSAKAAAPLARSLMADGYYVREVKDQEWHIRIAGTLPRQPGLYLIVLGAEGKRIFQGEVPSGTYTDDTPFVLTVPADGVTGDYVLKFIGQQDNLTGLRMPLTDLPFEVYGGINFAVGYGKGPGQERKVAFKVPPGVTRVPMNGWRGDIRVLKADGSVLSDSKTDAVPEGAPNRVFGKNYVEIQPTVEAGQTYWIDPYGVLYVNFKEPMYLTFDPARWFQPPATMDINKMKWWKGMAE